MNIGILLPGFSSDEQDRAIPVQHDLVGALAKDADVRVLALRYPHRHDRYRVCGAEVISLGAGQARRWRRLALWKDALLTLRRLHAEKPFDMLHAMWADETGLLAAWAGRWLRVPVVVSILGGELVGFDDIGYGLQRGKFSHWIVGQALKGADAVVITGLYAKRAIASAGYHVDDTRLHTIPLGVDTRQFYPIDMPRETGRLLHVGSLVGVKDQATLLRALARLDASVTLDIVGEGVERERLSSLAQTLGIRERVQFCGAVPHEKIADYYRRAALHILSSRSESMPVVALEAASCGLYTVGTAVGILPDTPAIAATVPIGDHAALADRIQALLGNPERLETLGQQAIEAVRQQFTIEDCAERLRNLYRELTSDLD
jgi:teichuronic acid biosynthesis glycosyltransferase TuaC